MSFSLFVFCMHEIRCRVSVAVHSIQYVGHRAITDLRNALYEKIIRLPIGFFQKNHTGRVISAVINDVEGAAWP